MVEFLVDFLVVSLIDSLVASLIEFLVVILIESLVVLSFDSGCISYIRWLYFSVNLVVFCFDSLVVSLRLVVFVIDLYFL